MNNKLYNDLSYLGDYMKNIFILILLVSLIISIGCAGKNKTAPKFTGLTDKQLYDKAIKLLEMKKWDQGT